MFAPNATAVLELSVASPNPKYADVFRVSLSMSVINIELSPVKETVPLIILSALSSALKSTTIAAWSFAFDE